MSNTKWTSKKYQIKVGGYFVFMQNRVRASTSKTQNILYPIRRRGYIVYCELVELNEYVGAHSVIVSILMWKY